jgi:hypothetical protein
MATDGQLELEPFDRMPSDYKSSILHNGVSFRGHYRKAARFPHVRGKLIKARGYAVRPEVNQDVVSDGTKNYENCQIPVIDASPSKIRGTRTHFLTVVSVCMLTRKSILENLQINFGTQMLISCPLRA